MSITISQSVGRGGDNRKPDARKIQTALNDVFPGTLLKVDGDCGTLTIRRIERFQRRFLQNPDGRVDPGGKTLKRLNAAVPSLQAGWSGDSSKWSEAKKLASIDSQFRAKTVLILEALRADGFKPKIHYAWRSVAVQRGLYDQGNSKLRFSFHNAQFKNGKPRAYAIDVIDRRWAWSAKAANNGFWAALGRAAKDEGLYWGGNWRSFKDYAHVQKFPNSRLTDIKKQSGVM